MGAAKDTASDEHLPTADHRSPVQVIALYAVFFAIGCGPSMWWAVGSGRVGFMLLICAFGPLVFASQAGLEFFGLIALALGAAAVAEIWTVRVPFVALGAVAMCVWALHGFLVIGAGS